MSDDEKTTRDEEPMFTRAQMAREVAKQVRAKVAESLAEYGDLDELRKKAATADAQRSKIDKMSEQLDAMAKRAEQAEIDVARQRVADKLGLTAKQAKRLSGKTYDELLADGEEMVEDLGITPKSQRKTETGDSDQQNGGGESGDVDDESDDEQQVDEPAPRPTRRTRPRELRPGAPMSGGAREETDPMKLVAAVPRR